MMDMMLYKNGMMYIQIGWQFRTQSKLLQLNHQEQFHYWPIATPGLHYPESRFYIRRIKVSKHSELLEPMKKKDIN